MTVLIRVFVATDCQLALSPLPKKNICAHFCKKNLHFHLSDNIAFPR